jgi:hypothetical protein
MRGIGINFGGEDCDWLLGSNLLWRLCERLSRLFWHFKCTIEETGIWSRFLGWWRYIRFLGWWRYLRFIERSGFIVCGRRRRGLLRWGGLWCFNW